MQDMTPESIVYMVANIGNRPDVREVQEEQVRRIREYGKRVEREALERAAKECEWGMHEKHRDTPATALALCTPCCYARLHADAIRALSGDTSHD